MFFDITDFQTFSGITDTTTATEYLTKAENTAFSLLGDFSEKERTEIRDGNGERVMVLRNYPIKDIKSLKVFGEEVAFEKNRARGEIYYQFPRGVEAVEVVYTAGWSLETIPDELKYAIYSFAMDLNNGFTAQSSGSIASETVDGASITYNNTLTGKDIMNSNANLQKILGYKQYYV